MTDEKLDLLLRQALNLEIADHDIQIDAAKIKSDRNTTSWKYWKHFPAAAASVAVLTLSSMMVCAAWHYLSAQDVAGKQLIHILHRNLNRITGLMDVKHRFMEIIILRF